MNLEPVSQEILPSFEIEKITGYIRPSAQCKALSQMRIPFLVRPNGTPAVSKEAAKQSLGVKDDNNLISQVIIDFDAI